MSKFIVCLGDGMSDWPVEALGNKTPLQAARTPAMDWIASHGIAGGVHTVQEPFSPGSDVANMGILGYDPAQYYTGRGPIEAASLGIAVPSNKIVFRCNLVHIDHGTLKDFTAGHIETEEAAQLIDELNSYFDPASACFFTGVSYRHLALLDEKFAEIRCEAPHDITGKKIGDHLPKGHFSEDLIYIMGKAREVLSDAAVNHTRRLQGKLTANNIWLWSQGRLPQLPSFRSKYGMGGGVVTAVDLLKGLGKLAGLETPDVPGATGFIDTHYGNKVSAALDILERHDFVYVHIEAPDEAGHMGDVSLKIRAIEDFDEKVVKPLLDYVQKNNDTAIMVLPDHPTPCSLRTHSREPVPVAVFHPDIRKDTCTVYDEQVIRQGSFEFKTPWDLTGWFLNKQFIS